MSQPRLFLVELLKLLPAREDRRYEQRKAWVLRRVVPPAPVAADNPVQAAEFFIARVVETSKGMLKHPDRCRVMVCEYVWDGTPGFKVAADTNGEIRYDVKLGPFGYFPVHSDRSFA